MRILHVLTIAAVGVTACSSTSVQQACTDLTTAICSKLDSCAPALLQGAYGDVGTCQERTNTTCESSLSLKNTSDTPDIADKCSKAYASLSCTDFFDNAPPAACTPTQPGKIANGSGCGVPGQCASNVCQIDPKTGCGTCIAAVPSGQPCKATTDCASGLVCAPSSAMQSVCVTPAASGATCSLALPVVPCQSGLLCSMGKCVSPLPQGAACDPKAPLCDGANGDWCTPLHTACVPILWATTGQPCGYNKMTGDLTQCQASGTCAMIDPKTLMGTCQAAASDNASCDVVKGPFCMPPAYCNTANAPDGGTNGTCTVISASCAGGGADGG